MKPSLLVLFTLSLLITNADAQNVGIGNTLPSSKLDVSGDLALREGMPITVSTGANAITLPASKSSIYRLTGASGAFSISSISAANDGMLLTLINATGQVMTVSNGSIQTGTGADLVGSSTASTVNLIYNATLGKWLVASGEGFTASSNWGLTGNAGTTSANFLGTTDANPIYFKTNNAQVGILPGSSNGAIVFGVGNGNPPGANNVLIGNGAGNSSETGDNNVALGGSALKNNVGGYQNVAIGSSSLTFNTSGNYNVSIGKQALRQNASGSDNIALGETALISLVSGSDNTAVGANAGSAALGSGNLFLGANAGSSETGSNKLYISNTNTTTPLLYGDFTNKHLTINDSLTAKYLQIKNGATANYILQSDASGNGTWVSPSSITANNIYNSDGTLTGNRTVTMGANTLTLNAGAGNLIYNPSGGFMGIGTTSPVSLLANTSTGIMGSNSHGIVNNSLAWAGNGSGYIAAIFNSNTSSSAGGLIVKVAGTSGSNPILDLSAGATQTVAGTPVLSALANGKVGIGNNSPTQTLDVSGTTKTTNLIMTSGATNGYIMQSDAAGNGTWVNPSSLPSNNWGLTGNSGTTSSNFIGTTDANPIYFKTNNAQVGYLPVSGTDNILLGLSISNIGTNNVGIGNASFYAATGGTNNIAIGEALLYNTTGHDNVGMGGGALGNNRSGNNDIAIGEDVLNANMTGSYNVAMGYNALTSNLSGSQNMSMGPGSLGMNVSGGNNVALGYYAGFNTLGSGNLLLGYQAGYNEAGSNKLYISNSNTATPLIYGDFSINHVTIHDSLTAKYPQFTNGASAGYVLQSDASGNGKWVSPATLPSNNWSLTGNSGTTSGTDFIGTTDAEPLEIKVNNSKAGYIDYTGSAANTSMGYQSANARTTGFNNVAFGYQALESSTSGSSNTAVGALALVGNTADSANVAIGYQSLGYIKGSYNIGIGYSAGSSDSGSNNIFIGYSTGNNTGSNNTMIGYGAGYYNNGAGNIFLGSGAGYFEAGSNKLYIANTNTATPLIYGDFSINHVTIHDSLTAKYPQFTNGAAAGYILQSDASGNGTWVNDSLLTTKYGWGLNGNSGTTSSNFIGTKDANPLYIKTNNKVVGYLPAIGGDNIYFGINNGTPSGTNNVIIGNASTTSPITGNENVAIGFGSLKNNAGGFQNLAIGTNALAVNTTGNYNIALTGGSLRYNTTGSNNFAAGQGTMQQNQTGSDNIALGVFALGADTLGSNNIAIGHAAGNNTQGSGSIFIGYQAGENETGSNKLYIDNNSTTSPLLYGDFNNNHLTINDSLTAKYLQMTNGATSGYVLQSDASGNASWVNPTSLSSAYWTLSGSNLYNNSGSNVGIGTTSPISRLANTGSNILGSDGHGIVQGSLTWSVANNGYAAAFYNSNTVASSDGLAVKIAGNTASTRILDLSTGTSQATTGTTVMAVLGNGNVGIGTGSPSSTLQVAGTTATTNFQMTNGGTANYLLQSDASGNASWVNPNTVATNNIYNSDGTLSANRTVTMGADNLTLNSTTGNFIFNPSSTGKMGIGTTTLSNTFNINGSGGVYNQNQLNFYTDAGVTQRGFVGMNPSGGSTDYMLASTTNGSWMRIGANNANIAFFPDGSITSGNAAKVVISNVGFVGVGTTAPAYPIDVETTGGNYTGNYYHYNNTGSGNTNCSGCTVGTNTISMYLTGRLVTAGTEIDMVSDRRIKDVIGISDAHADLDRLMKIEVTDYRYKDVIEKGNRVKKAFIAQQVESVYPEAVSTGTDFIPDVYTNATSVDYDAQAHTCTLHLAKEHGFTINDTIRLITGSGKVSTGIAAIPSPATVVVKWDAPKPEFVFVYGKQVHDFRAVDYDRVFALNVSATQELYKKIQALEKENDTQKSINKQLQSTETEQSKLIQTMKAQLDEVRERMNMTTSK